MGRTRVQNLSSSATFLGHPDRRWLVAECGLEPAVRFTGPGRQLWTDSDVGDTVGLGGKRPRGAAAALGRGSQYADF